MYSSISQFEPLLPQDPKKVLHNLALDVLRKSARLCGMLHPITHQALVDVVRTMNCYYSNLIEGHYTFPVDIERALKNDYDTDPQKRDLQHESVAHIAVQKMIEKRLHEDPAVKICQPDFLRWIHKEFFDRLPASMRYVKGNNGSTEKIIPGEFRKRDVIIGRHLCPTASSLEHFMQRFAKVYEAPGDSLWKIVAAAAAHHRLLWIHPFLDGNGRVARLFTDAFLLQAQVDGYGIWMISRGLARSKEQYKQNLALADAPRKGDLDGRGNLSDAGLNEFCQFFLQTASDQISFMSELLNLNDMQQRILGHAEYLAGLGKIKREGGLVLREVFLRGEVKRGEIPRITGKPERSARRILKDLLDHNLVASDTEKSPVRICFSMDAVEHYFPRLFSAPPANTFHLDG